jgi:hypothetical protein
LLGDKVDLTFASIANFSQMVNREDSGPFCADDHSLVSRGDRGSPWLAGNC